MDMLMDFFANTGFALADYRNFIMLGIGCGFIYLGIAKHYEPLLLVPIGFGYPHRQYSGIQRTGAGYL